MVADKSSHLKGTFQKALKDSVKALKEVFEELRTHSVSDETRQLEAANKRLKAELADVRCELRKIREDMERLQMPRWDSPPSKAIDREAPQPAAALGRPHVDDLIGAITVKVGRILDDRLGALERDGRLLPNKTGQTPLAVDRGRQAAQTVTPGKAAGVRPSRGPPNFTVEPQKGEKKKRKKAKSQPTAVAGPSAPSGQQPPPPAPGSSDQQWTSVVSRSARRRAAAQSKTQPQANTKRKAANEKAQAKAKTRSRGLRPPRSAAVVLTLQPEAEANGATYAKVLAVAKEKVKLSDLGISDLRFRRAATGARILQLPGVNSGEKADKLARELAEKLGEEVRVSRPTKCAELRLSNLDDSVTSEEVVVAVARAGECTQDQVKAGEIRRDHTGLGTVWVRCPVTAAKKVSDGGRFLVGWSSAQVKLLEPRILRCYRCLEVGHVRAQCQAQIDRGSLCYRCGKPDHKAAQCSAEPHCAVCEASGKSASHALGSKACTARGPRKDRKTRDGPPAPSQSSQPAATSPAASNALGEAMAAE
ncbi:actin cytoskeleton-regulatory complex protein pan1-like [Leguminivora glycinivorella]|uniref:actin cytoskeleton-regulatory complex protein pan1-like n=1 Tax=Leguminivora glycinivorella TaxID=1035111 RepID=UPI002010A792|nr:actin cytoskeleton-regulatory complex protein pan1-like [Leguminivora glycinivorella]